MKTAIIGCGFSADLHAAALKACGAELAAAVSLREESARVFAAKWNAGRWSTDPAAAFADDIDAVHICTPPGSHAGYVEAALRTGKRVLCEKPLGFLPEEAHKLAELAEAAGNTSAVIFNVRYHMAVQKARSLIAGGGFGKPLLIHGSYLQEFHVLPAPYDWRYDKALSGGMRAVTEIGTHWIDTAQYISGKKVKAVSASFGRFFPDRVVKDGMMFPKEEGTEEGSRLRVDSEDAACITFRYEDGAMGNVMLSEISAGRGNRLALEITCENGNLWWNEEENNVLHTARKGEGVRSEVFAFGNGFNDTFISLMRSFYEGKEVPTFREGAQIVDVCAAIAESATKNSAWTEVHDGRK